MLKYYNFKELFKFTYLSLFKSKNQNRLNLTRFAYIFGFFLLYIPVEIINNICFFLDKILFPRYQQITLKQPIFIIANPRSGTTFLQRLLAQDESQLTSMRTWEIMFAPSIIQRKIFLFLKKIDIALGRPLVKITDAIKNFLHKRNMVHKHALRAHEEDQYLMFHIWSSLTAWLTTGFFDETDKYIYFDQKMSKKDKQRIMEFYLECLKRHMYVYGADKRYLAKNPTATPRIKTLLKYFPDAKFIYLVRDPLKMVPSYISLHQFGWRVLGNLKDEFTGNEHFIDLAKHWYQYPLSVLKTLPDSRQVVIGFEQLVANADQTVRNIYQQLNLKISPEFNQVLESETAAARNYHSSHHYSLAEFGLTADQIKSEFSFVYEEFDFLEK